MNATGFIDLNSTGTMVTATNITSTSTPHILNAGISLLGGKAEEQFKKFFSNNKKSAGETRSIGLLAASTVKNIITSGGNFLVKKFFGRESTQTIVSNSDIKISSRGTITNKGTIVSRQQSNISPISLLPLPGSIPSTPNLILPSYNKPMGVWYLETSPIVKYKTWMRFYKVGEQGNGMTIIGYMFKEQEIHLASKPKVIINPAILPYLEKYTVAYKFQSVQKAFSLPPKRVEDRLRTGKRYQPNGVPFNNIVTYSPFGIRGYKMDFFSREDSLLVISPNMDSSFSTIKPFYDRQMAISEETYKKMCRGEINDDGLDLYGYLGDLEVKVTVTLYPKAPFNKAPIVSTRTFAPQCVRTKPEYLYFNDLKH